VLRGARLHHRRGRFGGRHPGGARGTPFVRRPVVDPSQPPVAPGQLGLVCIPFDQCVRFRTITRTRFLGLPPAEQHRALLDVYWDNLHRLHRMLTFCARRGIRLYRMTSSLFPMSDEPLGTGILREMAANLSSVGRRAERLGIRVVVHPDQFCVLSSESPAVVRTSVTILKKHALAMDLMGLPRTPWASILVHGGKAGRGDALVRAIGKLPANVRGRLCLENDEYSYSAADILDACRRAGVPMIFDNHHHAIKEKLASYDDPTFARMVTAARATWPDPAWQVVHLSNGRRGFLDREHSDLIDQVPPAYRGVPWIEVEAKGKEAAIDRLRQDVPWVDAGAVARAAPGEGTVPATVAAGREPPPGIPCAAIDLGPTTPIVGG
jgi:UV DNA damage endonuclease